MHDTTALGGARLDDRARSSRDERGAQAVEFALVLPVLLLLLLGIMEFGSLYSKQMMITEAARAAARSMALFNVPDKAQTAAKDAAPRLTLTNAEIKISPTSCPPTGDTDVVVTITRTTPMLTGLFGNSITITGTGVMRCGG
ncbi:pilus assembly protein [Tessaracoccus sp. SD287]|uniref:TadE/TadG family type IV pilus assembly protein n=1 Tax=Tessaracoccus sp. SD287 TaxID=2782008 RepID=UPI001A96DDED|nr:TadE/TadG family type IV pilus assembly protein [Tessaracoccus sp. SD287]MBO1031716.1 pilus assembly protein [Tessaracoccus sp. SD287]